MCPGRPEQPTTVTPESMRTVVEANVIGVIRVGEATQRRAAWRQLTKAACPAFTQDITPRRLRRSVRGKPREVHTRIDAELLEDVANMRIDSVRGDEKLVSDLPVGAPMRSKICDRGFGFGQCLPPGLRSVDFGATPSRAETRNPP